MYRIVCKFVPGVRYSTAGRKLSGSWRVVSCMQATSASMAVLKPVLVVRYTPGQEIGMPEGAQQKFLVLSSPSPRKPDSRCNPRTLLAEWLEARALVRAQLAACRQWADNPRYPALVEL